MQEQLSLLLYDNNARMFTWVKTHLKTLGRLVAEHGSEDIEVLPNGLAFIASVSIILMNFLLL